MFYYFWNCWQGWWNEFIEVGELILTLSLSGILGNLVKTLSLSGLCCKMNMLLLTYIIVKTRFYTW